MRQLDADLLRACRERGRCGCGIISNHAAMPAIAVVRLPHAEGLPLPAYATAGAAGMDVVAAITDPVVIAPGRRALVPTGICMAIPPGFEVQVRPRSGLALKQGVTCLNTPGTIDSDYRGELQVILANLGEAPVTIERGMRIAQIVMAPVVQATWNEVTSLDETARGSSGFGSTGVK
jgi:dUTP pyrophosphatase